MANMSKSKPAKEVADGLNSSSNVGTGGSAPSVRDERVPSVGSAGKITTSQGHSRGQDNSGYGG